METTQEEPQIKQKKIKPAVREKKRRAKPSEVISSKKLILDLGNTFRIQFPDTDSALYVPEMLAIGAEPAKPDLIPYNPHGDIPEDQLTYSRVYTLRQSEENLQKIAAFGRRYRFDFDSDILIRAQASSSEGRELERMSFAKSSTTIVLPKFGNGKKAGTLKPMPFQKAGIAYAFRAKRTFIADEMGLGKTIQALGTIAYDRAKNKLQPLQNKWLIVVPSSLRLNWFKELNKWLPKKAGHRITMIRPSHLSLTPKGTLTRDAKRYLSSYSIFVTTYDTLKRDAAALRYLDLRGIIFDESHYLKSRSNKRVTAWKQFTKEKDPEYILLLSGTPLMNKPTDLISQLQILNRLHEFGGFNHFLARYCSIMTTDLSHVAKVNKAAEAEALTGSSTEVEGILSVQDILIRKAYQNMLDLNKRLRSLCYVRREKSEVLDNLPEKTRQMIPLEITNRKLYSKIEADTLGFLADRAVEDKEFLKSIKKMSPENQKKMIAEHRASTYYKKMRAEAVIRIELLKQTAAAGKLKAVKQWIDDFLESGQKLVVFAVHKIIIQELLDMYPNAVSIRGADSPEKRQEAVDRFQTDKKVNLMIAGLKPGGVGHTLTASSTTVFIELGWNPAQHDQAEDRVHRIGQTSNVNAFYLLASKTVEQQIGLLIERKRRTVNSVASGDPLKDFEQGNVLGNLLVELVDKNGML